MRHIQIVDSKSFKEIQEGKKNFDIKKSKRPIGIGDTIILQETTGKSFTGAELELEILDVEKHAALKNGYTLYYFSVGKELHSLLPVDEPPVHLLAPNDDWNEGEVGVVEKKSTKKVKK